MQKLTNIAGQRSNLIKIHFVISYHPFFILMALTCGLQHARSCGYEAPSRTSAGTPFGSKVVNRMIELVVQRAVVYLNLDDIHSLNMSIVHILRKHHGHHLPLTVTVAVPA